MVDITMNYQVPSEIEDTISLEYGLLSKKPVVIVKINNCSVTLSKTDLDAVTKGFEIFEKTLDAIVEEANLK